MRSTWKILIPALLVAALAAGCTERETYYRSAPPAYSYQYEPGYSSYHYYSDDWRWHRWHDED